MSMFGGFIRNEAAAYARLGRKVRTYRPRGISRKVQMVLCIWAMMFAFFFGVIGTLGVAIAVGNPWFLLYLIPAILLIVFFYRLGSYIEDRYLLGKDVVK